MIYDEQLFNVVSILEMKDEFSNLQSLPHVIGWKKDGIYHKEKACDRSCSRRMFGPLFVLRHVDKGMRSTRDNWMTTLRLIPAEENSK